MTATDHSGPVTWGIVPAAGVGQRFGGELPKQYHCVAGRTLLECAIESLGASGLVSTIVVALAAIDDRWRALAVFAQGQCEPVTGGVDRAGSVLNALDALADRAAAGDWVLVHDAVRPCLDPALVRRLHRALHDHPVGGILALPVVDTLKAVDASGAITRTVARDGLWRAQTPQMFRFGLLREALAAARADGVAVTDEAMALELIGARPAVVAGCERNIKVTRAEDLELARLLAQERPA